MLDIIKSNVFAKYPATENRWLFISIFDANNNLLASNGVVETDKNVDQLIDLLYHGLLEKYQWVKTILVDVVTEKTQQTDMQKLITLPITQYGICMISNTDNKSGAMLPNTKWIPDVRTALTNIKQKYQLWGNVSIYTFQTDRITINL